MYPDRWETLRETVALNDGVLSEERFEQALALFEASCTDQRLSPRELTREWERDEFMLVVDSSGNPGIATPTMLEMHARASREHAHFARWFMPAKFESCEHEGQWTLMPNRWLCHLAGFRHQTVEIFIDPPNLPGFTLVQVRGIDKFEAPGNFDIPCAGHVSALDTVLDSLTKELGEELNLTMSDLDNVRMVARYDSASGRKAGPRNNEYRYLYQAQLKASSALQIRFADGEVAGLCIFSLPELQAFVQRFPERVASGLSGAIPYYDG